MTVKEQFNPLISKLGILDLESLHLELDNCLEDEIDDNSLANTFAEVDF